MKSTILALAGVTVALAISSTAGAVTTYAVNDPAGPGGVTGFIETDGTLGVLGTGNIVDYNLLLNDGSSTFDLLGPLSGNNSQVVVYGSAFTATATGLFYDFSSGGGFSAVDFQNPFIGSGVNYLCFNDTGGGCSGNPSALVVETTGSQAIQPETGVTLVAGTGVPEPAAWAMMLVGFASIGAALRSNRKAFAAA